MLPVLAAALPIASSLYGGYEGYKQSGGDLGVAALGAGLGAAGGGILPGAIRMAGARLAGTGLGAATQQAATRLGPEAYKASQLLSRTGTSTINPLAQQALGRELLMKGLGGAALLGGTAGISALAGGIASGTKNVAGKIIPTATGAVGTGRMFQGVVDPATGEVSFVPLGTDPASGMPRGPRTAAEILNPQGYEMGSLELQRRAQDVALEGAGKFLNLERPILDEAKTRDLARSAAAARLATDLATQQGLTLGGQRIAGAMGQQALGDVGAGLRTQYRYL